MDYEKLSLEALKQGFRFSREDNAWVCNCCNESFQEGQVYPMEERFYEAKYAVARHAALAHGGSFPNLLHLDSRYNTLTQIQKELLTDFKNGLSDRDIAKKSGITDSTVRRQKFTFREKAKQARLYLAVYEQVFQGESQDKNSIIPVHEHASYVDDRYLITRDEEEKILEKAFSSMSPLCLNSFPPKEKKKVVILKKIAEQFESGKLYSEKEVNEIIKAIYADYGTIRRYLVMYGHLDRKNDGSSYWLKD